MTPRAALEASVFRRGRGYRRTARRWWIRAAAIHVAFARLGRLDHRRDEVARHLAEAAVCRRIAAHYDRALMMIG